jgi:hypothetical protein
MPLIVYTFFAGIYCPNPSVRSNASSYKVNSIPNSTNDVNINICLGLSPCCTIFASLVYTLHNHVEILTTWNVSCHSTSLGLLMTPLPLPRSPPYDTAPTISTSTNLKLSNQPKPLNASEVQYGSRSRVIP